MIPFCIKFEVMNILKEEKEYDSLYMLGDLHDHFDNLKNWFTDKNVSNTCVVCVGDFTRGLGFATNKANQEIKLKNLNAFLYDRNTKLFTIRGNHDNPEFYRGNHDFSNIIFMPDYTILSVNEKRIFCLGGAISINRKDSICIEGIDWFPDEVVKIDEAELPNIIDIDIMVTHMAPHGLFPFNFHQIVENYSLNDETLKTDLNIERHNLRQFFDKISEQNPNLKQYFYGHYHYSHTMYMGNITFRLLDVTEMVRIL